MFIVHLSCEHNIISCYLIQLCSYITYSERRHVIYIKYNMYILTSDVCKLLFLTLITTIILIIIKKYITPIKANINGLKIKIIQIIEYE